ncbi:MAG: hypothetical protein CMI32_07260 [Opitutales bacterium]|jgi:hypothetical protein|nr:hypothetical protein [Opitutales bacterium]
MKDNSKQKDTGKDDSWVPKELISEVKSFANKEGKQMVGFVRSAIRNVVNPDPDQPPKDPSPSPETVGDWTLSPQSVKMLKTASEASGLPPAQLMDDCVSRALDDVLHDAEAQRKAARAKFESLKKDQPGH